MDKYGTKKVRNSFTLTVTEKARIVYVSFGKAGENGVMIETSIGKSYKSTLSLHYQPKNFNLAGVQ